MTQMAGDDRVRSSSPCVGRVVSDAYARPTRPPKPPGETDLRAEFSLLSSATCRSDPFGQNKVKKLYNIYIYYIINHRS